MAVTYTTRAAIRARIESALELAGLHKIHWHASDKKGGRAQKHESYRIVSVDWDNDINNDSFNSDVDVGVGTVALSFWVQLTQEGDANLGTMDTLAETVRKQLNTTVPAGSGIGRWKSQSIPDAVVDGDFWRQDIEATVGPFWLKRS